MEVTVGALVGESPYASLQCTWDAHRAKTGTSFGFRVGTSVLDNSGARLVLLLLTPFTARSRQSADTDAASAACGASEGCDFDVSNYSLYRLCYY